MGIKEAILFETGMLTVYDDADNQIPELSGPYSIETHKRIMLAADGTTIFTGFDVLPQGFINAVVAFEKICNSNGLTYRQYIDSISDIDPKGAIIDDYHSTDIMKKH